MEPFYHQRPSSRKCTSLETDRSAQRPRISSLILLVSSVSPSAIAYMLKMSDSFELRHFPRYRLSAYLQVAITYRTPDLASSGLHGLENPELDEGARYETLAT